MFKNIVIGLATMLFSVGVVASTSKAEFKQGDFELSLSATGSTPQAVDSFVAGGTFSLGYFLTDSVEASVRQGVSYTDLSGSNWSFNTQAAADFNFSGLGDGKLVPFVGGFFGPTYGDNQTLQWFGGPEGGVKYFLSEDTLLNFTVQYGLPFEGGDGVVTYGLGLSFKF